MFHQLRPACIGCKERHIRCDRGSPACSNCSKARPPRKCVLEYLKIRHSTYTQRARRSSAQRQEGPVTRRSRSQQAEPPEDSVSPMTSVSLSVLPVSDEFESGQHTDSALSFSLQSPSKQHEASEGNDTTSHYTPGSADSLGTAVSSSPAKHCLLAPAFCFQQESPGRLKVTDSLEQSVFAFYIREAGPWLDIASSRRHFGQSVIRLALKEPVLYAACLAYSSHVLFLNSALDSVVHDEFQDRAIRSLIPLLSPEVNIVKKDALLATVVILRMSEQFSEVAEDEQHHLRGSYGLFFDAQEQWSPSRLDLRGSAFWTYVRESIRVSFLNEKPCQIKLEDINNTFPTGGEEEEEEAWANHASYLLAKMCGACWGYEDADTRASMRDQVSSELRDWSATLPSAFQPWYSSQQDDEPFPTLKFLSPWHELAWQQFYTIKVMAAVYNTNRDSSSVLDMHRFIKEEIIIPAKMACSVCFSSDDIGCNINGAHLVSWCGRLFTGKEEQRQLAQFLEGLTASTNWPNRTCYDRLKRIWAGSQTSWVPVNSSD